MQTVSSIIVPSVDVLWAASFAALSKTYDEILGVSDPALLSLRRPRARQPGSLTPSLSAVAVGLAAGLDCAEAKRTAIGPVVRFHREPAFNGIGNDLIP